ncbi:PepSY domain-containing protein [Alteriqipengyuania sp. 357]
MKRIVAPLLLGCAIAATPVPALAQSSPAQDAARRDTQSGKALPLRQLEQIAFKTLDGPLCSNARNANNCYEYLGFAYDPVATAYRFRFIRRSVVIDVDIDARTGRVIGRSR